MQRPDLLAAGGDKLSRIERMQISFIRRTFDPGTTNRVIRWCQRSIGSTWIHHFTKHLRHVHGLERLPDLDLSESFADCNTASCSRFVRASSTTSRRVSS